MKKLLVLPLLLGFTSAVNAETWYLIASSSRGTYQVPMLSKENCETEGTKFKDLNSNEYWRGFRGSVPAYICLLGK